MPTPAVVPIVEDTWEPVEVARDALRSLVGGLQTVADWGIHFAIYTLPMLLLLLGVPALIGSPSTGSGRSDARRGHPAEWSET